MTLHVAFPRLPTDNPALYRDCDADLARQMPHHAHDNMVEALLGGDSDSVLRLMGFSDQMIAAAGQQARAA